MTSIGAGTELKRILRLIGISPCDNCEGHAIAMDSEGPDWCRQNINTIVGWLQEEATGRRLPFSRLAAKLLVLTAIRRARRKLRILEHA